MRGAPHAFRARQHDRLDARRACGAPPRRTVACVSAPIPPPDAPIIALPGNAAFGTPPASSAGMEHLAAWVESSARLGLAEPAATATAQDLLARWREPHRRYHDERHLAMCLVWWRSVRAAMCDPDLVALALWYHDAIYDPRAHGNEVDSALLAQRELSALGLGDTGCSRVTTMIRASEHSCDPGDPDARLFVDIDLAVLSAAPDAYAAYARDVRAEYAFVDDEAFRHGRATVLRSFLERPRIYLSPAFARREEQARANIAGELAALEGR